MKKGIFSIVALLVTLFTSYGQVSVSPAKIDFKVVYTQETDSQEIVIQNNSTTNLNINKLIVYPSVFWIKDSQITIPNGSSKSIWVYVKMKHNLFYNGEVFFNFKENQDYHSIDIKAQGRYRDTTYSSTENLSEEPLKAQLKRRFKVGKSLGYTTARDRMYDDIFLDKTDSHTCAYTARRAKFNSRSTALDNDFNCEHTFPQSMFNSQEPLQSDIYHLYPVDEKANIQRSNNPFGIVNNPQWQVGGSKWQSGLFEPRDAQKGNSARSLIYVVLIYQDYQSFVAPQETILRKWMLQDPPDSFEKVINDKIASYQKNRNPMIDHPEFQERITSFCKTSVADVLDSYIIPFKQFNIGTVYTDDTIAFRIPILNDGNQPLNLSKVTPIGHLKNIDSFTATIPVGEIGYIYVSSKIDYGLPSSYNGKVSVQLKGGKDSTTEEILFNGTVITSLSEGKNKKSDILILPNPAKNEFFIETSNPYTVTLNDICGKTWITERIKMGKNTINTEQMPTGMYFLHFYDANNTHLSISKKLLIVR